MNGTLEAGVFAGEYLVEPSWVAVGVVDFDGTTEKITLSNLCGHSHDTRGEAELCGGVVRPHLFYLQGYTAAFVWQSLDASDSA